MVCMLQYSWAPMHSMYYMKIVCFDKAFCSAGCKRDENIFCWNFITLLCLVCSKFSAVQLVVKIIEVCEESQIVKLKDWIYLTKFGFSFTMYWTSLAYKLSTVVFKTTPAQNYDSSTEKTLDWLKRCESVFNVPWTCLCVC